MPNSLSEKSVAEKQETRRKCRRGTAWRVPFVPDCAGVQERDDRLLVFMPHGLQQFFAFVLSDFATAFFSQIAHVEDSWLKVSCWKKLL